ncbi:MAG TPA: response regulator, partial [Balneolales bacterium]|nr:response regulator [Balneolales bacterium]
MFENKIRILLVDDDKDEYYILRALLDRIEDMVYELDWLYDYDKALNLMVSNEYDIYLLDYRLGIYNGIELMKDALNNGCDSPVIILTGQGERKIDIAAMRAGASDYMLKDEMQSHFLERSIRYAIERKKAQAALLESENRYRDLLENATDMILNIDINGSFLYVNNRWRNTLNYSEEELRGMTIRDVIYPGYKEQFDKAFEKLISGVKIDLLETAFVSKK